MTVNIVLVVAVNERCDGCSCCGSCDRCSCCDIFVGVLIAVVVRALAAFWGLRL